MLMKGYVYMENLHDVEFIAGQGLPGGLMVILDSPNSRAWKNQVHLYGVEKKLVEQSISAAGWSGNVHYTFAVPEPLGKDILSGLIKWGDWLRKEVVIWAPKKILFLGALGYSILIQDCDKTHENAVKITKVRGSLHKYHSAEEGLTSLCLATVPQYLCLIDGSEWFRDFARDIERLISSDNVEMGRDPDNILVICNTAKELQTALKKINSAPVVSLDIETGGLNFKVDKIEAIGIGALSKDRSKAYCIIIPHTLLFTADGIEFDKMIASLKRFIQGKSFKGIIALHNAKFDLKFIAEWLGEFITNPNIRDTLLLNYLLDERPINQKTSPHGLKNISRVKYDAIDYAFDWDDFWEDDIYDRYWDPLYKYLGLDLYYTLRLYFDLKDDLDQTMPEATKLYNEILSPAILTLVRVESAGVPLDRVHLKITQDTLQESVDHLTNSISELLEDTGGFIGSLNPNSPQQVAKVLYDILELPSFGKRTTAKKHLEDIVHRIGHNTKHAAGIKFIGLLLEYRGIKKTLSTYINPFLLAAASGNLYGQFNLAGTQTGRLSSEKPNLQNIPNYAGDSVRKGFIPPYGSVWIKADYSQLELRVAAELSRDADMLQAFEDGRDIHYEVASAMFKINVSEVTKQQRFAAKFVDFGILYGRGAASLAYGPELREYNWSKNQAQKFIDNYLDRFSRLRDWMQEQRTEAIVEQELSSLLGRKRRWPLVLPDNVHKIERQALNFPVQSLASDITLNALNNVSNWLNQNNKKSTILLIVHDELDLIVPWEELEEVAFNVKRIMEEELPLDLTVKIEAGIEIGPNWADLEDWIPGEIPKWVNLL